MLKMIIVTYCISQSPRLKRNIDTLLDTVGNLKKRLNLTIAAKTHGLKRKANSLTTVPVVGNLR